MKVGALIAMLQEQNPEAEVVLVTQSGHPLEHALRGVTTRLDAVPDLEPGRERGQAEDVLLVEGSFLRYGFRGSWGAARC